MGRFAPKRSAAPPAARLHPLPDAEIDGGEVSSQSLPLALRLFDHLVGAGEQRRWDLDAKRPGGLEIYGEFKFRRLLDWQLSGCCALQYFVDIDATRLKSW